MFPACSKGQTRSLSFCIILRTLFLFLFQREQSESEEQSHPTSKRGEMADGNRGQEVRRKSNSLGKIGKIGSQTMGASRAA
jgi:hypothetical protein